ncbi:unnamed protein product [Alternaria alternata]
MPRNSSPKRQRIDTDDVLPTQSASQVGSISVVDLSDRTTLTAPQGLKRSSSPTRNLTELRTATPSISLSPFNHVKQPPPANISARINSLRSRLSRREGLEVSYIPAGLREAIESDVLFAPSLAMDPIDPEAYDHDDTRPASHPALVNALDRVKNIFQDACHCTKFGRDENAWCFRVVWPLVELSMKLHCNTKFKLESQARERRSKEAELQISIWMAASLRKKMELARLAFPTSDLPLTPEDAADNATISTDKGLTTFQSSHLLEPAITIIGNEHKIYYAYPSSLKGDVTVLGPDEKFASLSTRSVQGIFKLVRFYRRMLAWGVDEEATTNMQGTGLWDAFLSPVLETLAKGGKADNNCLKSPETAEKQGRDSKCPTKISKRQEGRSKSSQTSTGKTEEQ